VNVSEEIFTSEMSAESYRITLPYISENRNFVIILIDVTPSIGKEHCHVSAYHQGREE
jgi:hypothetical protein